MQLDVVLTVRPNDHQVTVIVEVHRVEVVVAVECIVAGSADQAIRIRVARQDVVTHAAIDDNLREHVVVGQNVATGATVQFDP